MYNKAVYAGSFDPFTNGHLDIVKRSSLLFDEITVIIGVNTSKKRYYDATKIASSIRMVFEREKLSNCKVLVYNGPIAKYCLDNDILYSIRGLRNSMDYEYEENIAKINKKINPNLETIYIRTNDAAISSSMVREFSQFECFDLDFEPYVPREIYELMKSIPNF